MDDTACYAFFTQPTNPYHRQYEALRAVFIERHAPQEVAVRFGLTLRSLQQLIYQFRQHCRQPTDASPFFANGKTDGLLGGRRRGGPARKTSPTLPTVASWFCRLPNRCG
jgi:hypothetical protein